MLGLILGLGIALLLAGVEHFAQPLRALWRGLPLTLTLVLALVGYGTGKLLSRKLQSASVGTCTSIRRNIPWFGLCWKEAGCPWAKPVPSE